MSTFFTYDTLTWPEVAALPRDTPLVIPLGEGYPPEVISKSLGDPPRVGMLPPIPFGWEGSGLRLPEDVLGAFVANLLDSLREDGFMHLAVLTPPDVHLELGAGQNAMPCPIPPQRLRSGFDNGCLPPDTEQGKVVILPTGHTEQHGYHLPLSTDTLIIDAIAQGTAAAAPEKAVAFPTLPYGVSMHRPSFAGTLSAGGRAFEDFWLAAIDVLVERGFDRLYLLSGHGGNVSFLVNVVKYAGERHRRAFIATAFLYLSGPLGVQALEEHRQSPQGGMGHACELETSLILHLRPELVHMDRAVDEVDFISTPSYYMDWVEGGALVANPPWDDDTQTGAYGAGSLGTAEKGKVWLEAAIAEKVAHVGEIHEQFLRREERRKAGYGLWGLNR